MTATRPTQSQLWVVQYMDGLVTYLDLLALDRAGRDNSTCRGGRVERTTLGKCP